MRGGFFITVQQSSTAFSPYKDQKSVIAILMDVCDDTGNIKLCPRWEEGLQAQNLDVVRVDPRYTDRRDVLDVLNQANGIFLPGGNTNVHPREYGHEPISPSQIFGEGHVPKVQFSHERDLVSQIMVEHALETEKPLLAVCRGMQELNVALGGTLQQRINGHDHGYKGSNDWRDLAHAIDVRSGSLLSETFGRVGSIEQTSIHRQGMYREDISAELVISAMADDGRVVEAIEHPTHPFMLGTQFHAELSDNQPLNARVFAGFAGAVRAGMQTVPELMETAVPQKEGGIYPSPIVAAE